MIGNRIKLLREELGLKQDDLAKKSPFLQVLLECTKEI